MRFHFGKISAIAALVLVFGATAKVVFSLLDSASRERENAGMLVSEHGLYRKINDGNALFSSISVSPNRRRVVLMLAREPKNLEEYETCSARLARLEKTLPPGNRLFLTDDSGNIFLEREIKNTRKVFGLADEIRVLFARLKSVPVYYFPSDGVRPRIDTSHWEGNSAFPVPETEGVFLK